MAKLYFLYTLLLVVEIFSRNLTGGLELGLGFDVEPGARVGGATLIAVKGRPLRLDCVPDLSSGPASVVWLKDDVRLGNTGHYTVLNNGSLVIDKIVHKKGGAGQTDQGVYRCLISNSLGALLSRPTRVRVAGMSSEFSHHPPSLILAATGDVILLPCTIKSVPNAAISWQRDGKPLLPQSNKHMLTSSGSLYVINTDYADSGNYTCTASNPVTGKTKTSPDSVLTVVPRSSPLSTPPVEFLSPPTPTLRSLSEGESLVLECAARGRPSPPLLEWVFTPTTPGEGEDGPAAPPPSTLPEDPNLQGVVIPSTVSHSGLSLLSLASLSPSQAGHYTCRASTEEMGTQLGPSYQIEVLRPPKLLSRPQTASHPIGWTERFSCEVDGVPKPSVVWLKDGKRLTINGRIKQWPKELLISNTVSEDVAIYQCVASNAAGEVWAASRFLINSTKVPIHAPSGLKCTALSPRQIKLSWEHVLLGRRGNRATPEAFTVHFLPTDGGNEQLGVVVSNRTFIVTDLQPYTNYTFYVRAYGGNTVSDQSDSVTCLTLESVPVATPTLQFPTLSSTWFNVTWSPLPFTTARGDIVLYKIQWRIADTSNISYVDQVFGKRTHYIVTGLQPDTLYEVRVLGRTSQGFPSNPAYLGWTPLHTGPALPYLSSLSLRVSLAANQISALLSWVGPEEMEGWRVSYETTGGGGWTSVFDEAVRTCVLDDLDPDTLYRIRLVGLLPNSLTTDPITHYLYTGAQGSGQIATLAPPSGLDAKLVTTTALNVTWMWSATEARELDHYSVSVSQSGGEDEKIIESSVAWLLLSDLQPYTWYLFKVKVSAPDGEYSEYSYGCEFRTMQGVPSPVREIQAQALNQTAIAISWKPPLHMNGVLSMYLVSFSLDPGLPLSTWPYVQIPADITYAEIAKLSPRSTYFLSVRAVTQAGVSESAQPLTVATQVPEPPSLSPDTSHTDQLLGIIVGCSIGACCIALCTGTLLYKRRCKPPATLHNRGPNGLNGAGAHCRVSPHRTRAPVPGDTLYEMQYLGKEHGDLDCYTNGRGAVHFPLIPNGRLPNGSATIVRITENPQFSSLKRNSRRERDSDVGGGGGEGDSLLSAVLDESHLTHLETSGDTHLTHLENSGGREGEGGDSGFCGGGDDRVLPSPTALDRLNLHKVPCVPSLSPRAMDMDLVDDGFHEVVSTALPSEVVTALPNLPSVQARYCTRSAGAGVASKC